MTKDPNEERKTLALVEKLLADQGFLIDTRLKELDPSPDWKKSAAAALQPLRDISALAKALPGTVRKRTGPKDG